MAVPVHRRAQGKLLVLTKARELASHTIQLCSNEKYFPKRSRWILANRIVSSAMTIMEECDVANSIYVSMACDYELRRNSQTIALATTTKLLGQLEIAYARYALSEESVEYWTGLVIEVRELIRAWRQADKDKYKDVR